jgi:hypothetical protein
MAPKQEERIKNKIDRIRKELAADKKRWGGFYDDSCGLRYLPPEQFIKLKDNKGGLRFLSWFNRTFPHDNGYPIFCLNGRGYTVHIMNKWHCRRRFYPATTNPTLFCYQSTILTLRVEI